MNIVKNIIISFVFMALWQMPLGAQSSMNMDFGIVMGGDGNMISDSIAGFRNGYTLGMHGDYGTYGFYISPGVYFQDFTIDNNYKYIEPFVKSERIKLLKAKVLLGYKTNLFTRKLKFKFGGGFNGSYIINIAKNDKGVDFKSLSDTYYAYSFDVGLDIFSVSVNLSYEKTLKEVLSLQGNSGYFDFVIVTLGVRLW